jgi:hypothetical protein
MRVEIPHYVPINRDFIRNDMAIRWLLGRRSGDSQIKASKMLTVISNRHFFPCLPHIPCHPERQRGIFLFFRYFHTFPTPSLCLRCAGICFISSKQFLLRRLFWEEVFFLQIFRPAGAGYLAVLDFKRPQSLVLGIRDYRLF